MTSPRPLRVLHLGNIANNALRNAQLQRQRGIDAEVLCFDYYHTTGCPEHLSALTSPTDADFPDWWAVGAKGRPLWFAQGPLDICLKYLAAGRWLRPLWWHWLELERWLICRRSRGRKIAYYTAAILTREWIRPPRGLRRALLKQASSQEWWEEPGWDRLLDQYDIVQCYATLTAIPYRLRRKFVAYEHGTLRAIPFKLDAEGALCWLSYRAAAKVFITNLDCIESANRMAIPRAKRVYLPHAFDEADAAEFRQQHWTISPPASPIIFFAPARQQFTEKGNDKALRAFAKIHRLLPGRARLKCIDWGQDVAQARQLITDLGIADSVDWLPILSREQLWRQYLLSHAVLDQFVLGAIGGIGIESMALSRRLISRLDTKLAEEFFDGEASPILIASTPEEIAERMLQVIDDPADSQCLGAFAEDWMRRRHSGQKVVDLQAKAYRELLGNREDIKWPSRL